MKPDAVLPVILAGGLLSTAAFASARYAEDLAIQRAVDEETAQLADRFAFDLDARTRALSAMAQRWQMAGGLSDEDWKDDASQHATTIAASFQAIERLDDNGVVRAMVPEAGKDAEAVTGANLSPLPGRTEAMRKARERGGPAIAAPVELLQGGAGFLVFVPLTADWRFDGWLAGVVRVVDFVREAHGTPRGYHVEISHDGYLLYESASTTPSRFCATAPLSDVELGLVLEVCGGPTLLASLRGPLPVATVLVAVGFTALSAALAHALGVARAHATALERARRELAALSYSVSHDMRTPLRAIEGYAAMLEEDLPPGAHPALARIRTNARRMAAQIDGLIQLMHVARKVADKGRVDVHELVEEVLSRKPRAREADIRVASPLTVTADPELVEIILDALLDNALKFTRGRAPAVIEVGPLKNGFYVRDNGVGFDMAYIGKLFGTFERLHAPGEFEGLGLGLAVAARAAESNGARLDAESRPGEGATFRVTFPR